MLLRRTLLVTIALAFTLVVSGCKINSINSFPPHPASIRVINLMPDAPSLDVQVAGTPAFTGVAYESWTGVQSFDNVTTSFSVNLTGSSSTLISFSYPLAGEQPYVLVLYGTTAYPRASLLAEVAEPPTNGNIQLSVFNGSINSTGFDVYVTAPGVDISTLSPNFYNVTYGGITLNLALPPGTYQVRATTQGTKTVIYDSGGSAQTPNIALLYIYYSRGSGTLLNAAVLQSQGPGQLVNTLFARIKAMNGALAVGSVNQQLESIPANLDIGFGTASSYFLGPQGDLNVNYEATATPGATLAAVNATLPVATDSSSFIAGPPGAQQAFVLADDNLPPTPGNTRLRIVNTAWNSNPVNVTFGTSEVATALAYPNASAYAQVAIGTATITFTDATTGEVVATIPNVALTGGTATAYLYGQSGGLAGVFTQDNN
ncbi:MAG: DUF4397 domain-containing protein [Burkholderiales bacterium]|nr:DUF4397 domain-containing protein [Burkholderiales bacterium]